MHDPQPSQLHKGLGVSSGSGECRLLEVPERTGSPNRRSHTEERHGWNAVGTKSQGGGGGEEGNERAWRRRRRCVELGSGGLRLPTAVGAVHSALLVLLLPAHDSQTRCNRPLLQRILSLAADLTTPVYRMVEIGRLRGRRDAIQAKVGGRDQQHENSHEINIATAGKLRM